TKMKWSPLPFFAFALAALRLVSADVCNLVGKVNAYRLSYNLPPLVIDVRLVQIAQEHSDRMATSSSASLAPRPDNPTEDSLDNAKALSIPAHPLLVQEVGEDAQWIQPNQTPIKAGDDMWYAEIEQLIPNWNFLAENVGMGSNDENAILDLFKSTEEYNGNLLSDEASLIGIGEMDGYWTFEFAGVSDESGVQAVFC
ncbi:hypothetical protein BC830DRAFT_1104907, partial [Chytriomyces sp. MP71]